jgi:Na+-driven multidrug efflux pump
MRLTSISISTLQLMATLLVFSTLYFHHVCSFSIAAPKINSFITNKPNFNLFSKSYVREKKSQLRETSVILETALDDGKNCTVVDEVLENIDSTEDILFISSTCEENVYSNESNSPKQRLLSALPSFTRKEICDETDKNIIKTAVPSMLNMAVVPIVNSVDTFWVGRLGIALALAGQAAANQAFFTFFFLISFLPTITAPLVAKAVGSGDTQEAQTRICEALFLCNILGAIGTIMLAGFPRTSLGLVLSKDAAAMEYAVPYLRFRALSMIPALISSTGFSAYRGLLNTVTPLKVSLVTNLVNLVADPVLISGFGVGGAAIATAGAEGLSGLIYLKLLMRRKLLQLSKMFKVPSWSSLKPLIQGGGAMLLFQLVLNIAFTTAARRVQAMDPTGVSAAAYGECYSFLTNYYIFFK